MVAMGTATGTATGAANGGVRWCGAGSVRARVRARTAAMSRFHAFVQRHWPLALLLVLAGVLRVPWLGAIPSPAGDEGNWTWYGYNLLVGWPVELPPDGRFVTLAFAHLIALSYRLLGPGFAAARAVLVTGVLAGMVLAWWATVRLGLRRAGITVLALLAVHPWSVLWSRTVTVPYALDLALGVSGPLCLLAALHARSFLGLVLAAQVLAVGVQFSPLAVIPMVTVVLWVLRRAVRTSVSPVHLLVAGLLGGLHLVPVALGAAGVAHRGTTRPSYFFNHLGTRLYTYGHTVLGGLGGEATVRHFTGDVLPPWLELLVVVGVLGVLTAAWPRRSDPVGEPRGDLGRYAALHLAVALVGLPLVLSPARPWNLPAIDAERYLFAVLCPAILCVGALAERTEGRARWLALAVVLYLSLGPTRRIAASFLLGGSVDRGFYLLDGGGGYRGWKVPREREAAEVLIRREALRIAQTPTSVRTTVVMADYAFHPLHFADMATGLVTTDATKYPLTVHPGERYVFVVYTPALFGVGFRPVDWVRYNNALVARMHTTEFTGLRRVRVFVQANGTPYFELWTAEGRGTLPPGGGTLPPGGGTLPPGGGTLPPGGGTLPRVRPSTA